MLNQPDRGLFVLMVFVETCVILVDVSLFKSIVMSKRLMIKRERINIGIRRFLFSKFWHTEADGTSNDECVRRLWVNLTLFTYSRILSDTQPLLIIINDECYQMLSEHCLVRSLGNFCLNFAFTECNSVDERPIVIIILIRIYLDRSG
uniref:Putative secreted protein n=1 Tax=Anopheles darlingi TaxID=43151 RepID=A0A2M4DME0_ANODA